MTIYLIENKSFLTNNFVTKFGVRISYNGIISNDKLLKYCEDNDLELTDENFQTILKKAVSKEEYENCFLSEEISQQLDQLRTAAPEPGCVCLRDLRRSSLSRQGDGGRGRR